MSNGGHITDDLRDSPLPQSLEMTPLQPSRNFSRMRSMEVSLGHHGEVLKDRRPACV